MPVRPSFKNKKNNKRNTKVKVEFVPNYSLIGVVVLFLLFGLLMIFSASAVIAFIYQGGDTFYFFKRQILWIIIGTISGFFLYKTPMYKLKKLSLLIMVGSLIAMLYLVPEALFGISTPFVDTINGATRWINIGITTVQPVEFAKLGIILFASAWFTLSQKNKNDIEGYIKSKEGSLIQQALLTFGYKFLPFIIMGVTSVLVLIQKDLDTIVIIGLIFISIFYVSNKSKKHNYITFGLLSLSGIVGLVATLGVSFRRSRFQSFLQILLYGEPTDVSKRGESFQVWNGLVAIGTGGLFGVGYGESRQKLFYLQEAAYTDSIFAIIGEEFGLFGTLTVILGFLIILSIGLKIAKEAPNKFESLVAVGITSWITIQAFLNIAANLSIIPFGGIPLPFLTYGGSNTIMILAGIGILLNIGKKRKA